MSLSGATRALGSSIIDGSYLEAGWTAPGGDYLFTGSGARRKGCAAPLAPRKCALLGYGLADGLQAVENRGVRTLNAGPCAPASPSIGPREANFFPYLSIQLTPVRGSFLGLGITRFRLAWKVRALTPLSPWGGLHAHRFRRDVSTRSDRQGGLSVGGTVGHRGATSARRRGTAPRSHKAASAAAPAGDRTAAPTDDRADAARALDRTGAAPSRDHTGRGSLSRRVWAQARRRRLGRRRGGFGHHELPRTRTGSDRLRAGQQRDRRLSSGGAAPRPFGRDGGCGPSR